MTQAYYGEWETVSLFSSFCESAIPVSLDYSSTYWLRSGSGIQPLAGLVCRVQDSFTNAWHLGKDVPRHGLSCTTFPFHSQCPSTWSVHHSSHTSAVVAQRTKRQRWQLLGLLKARSRSSTVSLPPFLLFVKTGRSLDRCKGWGNRSRLSGTKVKQLSSIFNPPQLKI